MKIADQIKQVVSTRKAAEFYGFEIGRSGFMRCPFHQGDNTSSLKIYEGTGGWHCFGCGKGGSTIDFVMELFGLTFRQAVLRINADFNLGLTQGKPIAPALSRMIEERRAEQRKAEQKKAIFRYMILELWYWKEALEVFHPTRDWWDVYYHPMYVTALHRLPYIEYWLDEFLERVGGDTDCLTYPISHGRTI